MKGFLCVAMNVRMQPGSKRCHKLQVRKEEQNLEVILSIFSASPVATIPLLYQTQALLL